MKTWLLNEFQRKIFRRIALESCPTVHIGGRPMTVSESYPAIYLGGCPIDFTETQYYVFKNKNLLFENNVFSHLA